MFRLRFSAAEDRLRRVVAALGYLELTSTAFAGSTVASPSITAMLEGETVFADNVETTSRSGPITVPFAMPITLVLKVATGVRWSPT